MNQDLNFHIAMLETRIEAGRSPKFDLLFEKRQAFTKIWCPFESTRIPSFKIACRVQV